MRLARYLGVLLVGCGAASAPRTTARSEPLPVSENQQGHVAHIAVAEAAMPASEVPLSWEVPSIAGVYLWCQDPAGRACHLASNALGTGPKDPRGLPPGLLTVEDLADDCVEPTIAAVGRRLSAVFAVQPTGWRDQSGGYLDSSLMGDMYQAAGCINDADPASPIAKISAGDGSSPRVYLVRVWDAAGAYGS